MCNIIIEKEAILNLKSFLIKNYENKSVAFVTKKSILFKNKQFLQSLKNMPLRIEVYFVEDFAKCDTLNTNLVLKMVQNSELVVGFGDDELIDIVKYVSMKLNIKYVLLLNMVNCSNYISKWSNFVCADGVVEYKECNLPECVYVDLNIVQNTPLRYVANAFAYVLSTNIIFVKMLYGEYDENKIKRLNDILKSINMFTSQNIITSLGKTKLIKLVLELQLELSNLDIVNPMYKLCSIYNKFYNQNSTLLNGEVELIFCFLILHLEESIITNKLCLSPININKRISRLKTLFNKEDYVSNMVNNLNGENVENTLNDIAIKKDFFLKYVTIALNRVGNNFAMLKRIYIDKGVIFNNLVMEQFYNTLSLACDLIDEKFLSVFRAVGLMDNI